MIFNILNSNIYRNIIWKFTARKKLQGNNLKVYKLQFSIIGQTKAHKVTKCK